MSQTQSRAVAESRKPSLREWFLERQLELPLIEPVFQTTQETQLLHETLLQKSLEQLFDGRSTWKTREEIIAWVARDIERNKHVPFSFAACTQAIGWEPHAVQQAIIEQFDNEHGPFDDLDGYIAEMLKTWGEGPDI